MCLPDSYHLNGVCQIPNTSLMSLRFQLNTSVWCLLEYQLESVCQSPTERRWLQKYVCRKVVCYKTMTEPLVQQDTSARFRSSSSKSHEEWYSISPQVVKKPYPGQRRWKCHIHITVVVAQMSLSAGYGFFLQIALLLWNMDMGIYAGCRCLKRFFFGIWPPRAQLLQVCFYNID